MKISIVLAAMTGSFETDMNRASKTAQKRMKELEKTAKEVGRVLGVALAAGATAAAVAIKSAIDRADELSKAAQKIGVTTEALSALAYAAELADVDLATLQGGLARLTKFQSEAAMGTEKNVALFAALGIEFRNLDGTLRNTEDVFRDFAKVFQTLPDGASKTALALDVFGRSGANLIPLLNSGADGLDAMREEAERLGIVIDTETGRAAEEFNDNLTRLKVATSGLASQIAADLLPDLVSLTDAFVEAVSAGEGVSSTAHEISEAFRGTAEFGAKVFNVIKAMTLAAVGFYAKVGEAQQRFTLARFTDGAEGRAQAFGDLSAVSFAGAEEAIGRVMNGPDATAPSSSGSSGSPNGRGRGVKVEIDQVSEALSRYYDHANSATAATASLTAARDAEREAAKAAAELEEREADAMEELAKRKAEQYDELQEIRQREIEDMARAKELVDQTLADIAFETKLLGLNNLEREKAIALRYANVDAASAEGQAIVAAIDQMDEAARNAEGVDFLKGEMKGLLVDLTDGVGSLSDAWDSFFDNLTARVMQLLADQLIEQLFSSMSGGGQGGGGGWMAAIGSLFGGARAGGGPVSSGKAYLVGEEGPELVIPSAGGTVIPAGQTAGMMGRGDTIQILGSTSKRSLDRLSIERGRRQRQETARTA